MVNESTTIELEMGLSEKEFGRALPNAVKPYQLTTQSYGYLLDSGDQQIQIETTALPPRAIASARIPRTMVVLKFSEQSKAQIDEFMQRFNRYMHRGGG